VAMSLHWLIALLIVCNIIGGVTFSHLMQRGTPAFFAVIQIHKSIGLTVLVLSILRLMWRIANPVPALPPMSPKLRLLARGTHYLFYFLIIAIPLAGWLTVSASTTGAPTMYFGLFRVPMFDFLASLPRTEKPEWHEFFETFHQVFAYGALALLVLHVSAALWHHMNRKDAILRRMWFGTNVQDTA